MNLPENRSEKLQDCVQRFGHKQFLVGADDAVSLRLPGTVQMLFWQRGEARLVDFAAALEGAARLHAECYRLRADAGAVASLSPPWSLLLGRRRKALVTLFDEQARHIGPAWEPEQPLAARLGAGGNAGMENGQLLVLGVTARRLVFNAELFEKCAQAFVLADATGQRVGRLPWWVCRIAGRRLRADQRRAAASLAQGQDAAELQAY